MPKGSEQWWMPATFGQGGLLKEFKEYQRLGGGLGFNAWNRQGKPKPPTGLSAYGASIFQRPEVQEAGIKPTRGTAPTGQSSLEAMKDYISAQQTIKQLKEKPLAQDRIVRYKMEQGYMIPVYKDAEGKEYERWDEAKPSLTPEAAKTYPLQPNQPATWTDNSGTTWTWDEDRNDYVKTGFDPTKTYQTPPTQYTQYGQDPYGGQGQWNPYTGQWEQPAGYISPYQQKQIELQEQQMAIEETYRQQQLESEKQARLAELRANPQSWLEYASAANETPSVQPWMLPLMPQQYQGAQAGGAIPGYQATGTSMGLPELTNPSAQYMSRISPSAKQQYMGYEKARTGQTPEDVQWRLWAGSPPGGSYPGLRRIR